MTTKFEQFLNEYGGPYKTAGFRYSEPNKEYTFNITLVINPAMNIKNIDKSIKSALDRNNVEENWFEFEKMDGDAYSLSINLTAYSTLEVESMFNVVLKDLVNEYGNNIIIDQNTIDIVGPDVEPQRKKIGY